MAALQEATSFYGFKARWELDEQMALSNTMSEKKPVDGMSDVKWNLHSVYYPNDRRYQIFLIIESKNEISYTVNLYYFTNPGAVHSTFNGTSTGQKHILLENVPYFIFQSHATSGKLIISVDGKFSYASNEQISNNSTTAAEFGLRLKENVPIDFDIAVDGKTIQIHKIFVAAESPVFSKMFESNFKEAAEKKVEITDANYETVQAAMDYCYRQNISDFLQDLTNSINLIFFCDKYDFKTLKPMLEEHLSTKFLTKENISVLVSTADQTNALKLRQTCIGFMYDLAKKEWVLLLKANFSKDFDIVIDEKLIQIHKHFIAIESPVFAKMFESNFKEAAENKITITDAKHETVQAAMDYCYRQDISDFLQDLTNSINLLFFCDKYDFQTLKPILEKHLSTKFLTKENISLLVSTSDQTNALKLRQTCIDFMYDLAKKGKGLSAEEIAKFDAKFKDDVLLQAFK